MTEGLSVLKLISGFSAALPLPAFSVKYSSGALTQVNAAVFAVISSDYRSRAFTLHTLRPPFVNVGTCIFYAVRYSMNPVNRPRREQRNHL